MLIVCCGCGLGVENVTTITALSRRIDGVEGVSWCGEGSVVITEQHSMFAVAELMPFTTGKRLAKSRHSHRVGSAEKTMILDMHNQLRASVTPSAANIMRLAWDDEVAMVAQAWAEACQLKHDQPKHRAVPGRLSLGQNVAVGKLNWTVAILSWYGEKENFTFGGNNSLEHTAQYFQMVWAETTRLGCGYADCDGTSFFVCNYGPSFSRRYGTDLPYHQGASCGDCPSKCVAGLCDCGLKFCENEGELHPDTCSCCCITHFYKQDTCLLDCSDVVEDEALCGGDDVISKCNNYHITSVYCPRRCNVCPYADVNYTDVGVTSPPLSGPTKRPPVSVSRSSHAQCTLMLVICCTAVMAAINGLDQITE
ncbi:cysteine-rich venom protein Mr30-like [Gigantopelta aegis]|uniref:cysteine-rich venom protein Mr30-like n=1 Tax=Gigantopelta aegis TaxID=1735272 RepID=UPI001B88CF0C|nr:cysteine-rich venom protein Mr30-like [Gigantopelta aegis]